jgi:hypothetical protein
MSNKSRTELFTDIGFAVSFGYALAFFVAMFVVAIVSPAYAETSVEKLSNYRYGRHW